MRSLLPLILACSLTSAVRAGEVNFNDSSDFNLFTFTNQNATLGFDATGGAGNSGSGAFIWQSTAAGEVDKRVLALHNSTVDGTRLKSGTMSVLIKGDQLLNPPAGVKYKAHVRVGLIGGTSVPMENGNPKLQDIYKANPSFSNDFKIEVESKENSSTGETTLSTKLSVESKLSPGGNAETKGGKIELGSYDPDHWYRATLRFRRSTLTAGAWEFATDLYDAGADGLGSTLLNPGGTESAWSIGFNLPFGQNSALIPAIVVEGEKKSPPGSYTFAIDQLSWSTEQLPEPPAIAGLSLGADGKSLVFALTGTSEGATYLLEMANNGLGDWQSVGSFSGARSTWTHTFAGELPANGFFRLRYPAQ